jgi:nucleoid-associated protein YgaU
MKTKIYTGADGTLFHIAARELGDATQWYRIAEASNLSDYMIVGAVVLHIPDPDPTMTGGLPPL